MICHEKIAQGATQQEILAFLRALRDQGPDYRTLNALNALEASLFVHELYGVGLHDAVDVVRNDPLWRDDAQWIET